MENNKTHGERKVSKIMFVAILISALLIGAVIADLAFNNKVNVSWSAINEPQATFTVNGQAYANLATINAPLGNVNTGDSKDITFNVKNTAGQQISFTATIISVTGATTSSLTASTTDSGVTVDTANGHTVGMTFEDSGTTGVVTLHLVGFTLGSGNAQLTFDATIT